MMDGWCLPKYLLSMQANDINSLIARLKQAETLTHYWHLRTTSYARHMALGGFYEALQGLADALVESHIGMYGVRPEIPESISLSKPEDHEVFLKDLGEYIDMYITIFNKDLPVQDHLLDIRNLINKTLYLFTLA